MGEEGIQWFFAKVENLQDPLMLGRAKIRVFGDHQGLDTEDLPWAVSLLPITSASNQQVGSSPTGLEIGSRVMGMYLDGQEKQKPVIWGSIAQIPEMDNEKHDVSKLARGENSLDKQPLGPEPASAYAAQYPENKVYQTKTGHVVEFDDTPGAERIHVYHKSGTYTEINYEGQRVDKTVGNYFQIIQGKQVMYVKGEAEWTAQGELKIKSDGNITIDATKVYIKGDDTDLYLTMG